MNAALLQQTALHLTRQTRRWDRRMRLGASLVWLPRAIIAGLLAGVALAVGSRLRAWLLPEQIALVTALVAGVLVLGALGVIWLRPRTATGRARYFDLRFGLKERISTALELAGGRLPLPDALAKQQLDDAVRAARGVHVQSRLPLRMAWSEVLLAVVLGAALAYLLLADNPRLDALRAEQALDQAIAEQAAQLEQAIQQVEANPALTEEQKAALTEALREAQDALQQPNLSQEEAVAALAEAGQVLHDLSDGMSDAQEAPYQQAASELAGSELTADMADALQKPDLGQAADAADALARQLVEQNLSPEEQQALADRLESAADRLEESNPALADKLREAAEALREGDMQAAQQALEEAADLMRQQQTQLENSPMAQAAQQAEREVRESQRQLSEAGQEAQQQAGSETAAEQQSGEQQAGQPQSAQQSAQQQSGEEAQADQQADSATNPQQSGAVPQTGDSQAAQSGESGEGQVAEGQPEGSISQSPQAGEAQAGAQLAEGQPQGEGAVGAPASEGEGQTAGDQGDALGESAGENAPAAGSSEGGAGSDTTQGQQVEGVGELPSSTTAQGGFEEYNPQYTPSTLGGESADIVQLANPDSAVQGAPIQQGDFASNPAGQAVLTFRQVIGRYQDIVSDALESGRLPLDQRDVIHDYFSSLNR